MTTIRTSTLKRVKAYNSEVQKIMYQNEQIWPMEDEEDEEDNEIYLTLYNNDQEVTFSISSSDSTTLHINLEYSLNDGEWKTYSLNDTIDFGGSLGILRLRGTNNTYGTSQRKSSSTLLSFYWYNTITLSSRAYCKGDIRTLINYKTYETCNTSYASFNRLFYNAPILSAPKLPATDLAIACYYQMFYNCSLLKKAPDLPATTLKYYCYEDMFDNCTSLKKAPIISATSLASYCCRDMFSGCTSLTTAPNLLATSISTQAYAFMFANCKSLTTAPALPATTLGIQCYWYMFNGCDSLTTAPALPATTLRSSCYQYMFATCTSLTTAPALPSTQLVNYCYRSMFNGCTSLNYIKMMATNISALDCLDNWTKDVSSSGTFVKNAAATWDESTVIPSGWTVQTATS